MEDRAWQWPGGAAAAVSFTFDVDAEAGFLGDGQQYERQLTTLSEGRFGVTRGVPRLLSLLELFGIKSTFFVPGYTAFLHPETVDKLVVAGHEIAHHGYMHLRADKVAEADQRAEIERGLSALNAVGVEKPSGYRSPAWEMTPETFDLLLEYDFEYESRAAWVMIVPTWKPGKAGRCLSCRCIGHSMTGHALDGRSTLAGTSRAVTSCLLHGWRNSGLLETRAVR